jgi:hypothetical protein
MRCRTRFVAMLAAGAAGLAITASAASAAAGGYVEVYRSNVFPADSSVYASASNHTPVTIAVARGGAVVAQTPSAKDYAYIAKFSALAGDEIRVDAASGRLATYAFDGLPSMDATTCQGATTFSGIKSPGAALDRPVAYKRTGDPYAPDHYMNGTLTSLNGNAFGGTWPSPLTSNYALAFSQSLPLASGWIASSYNETLVPTCPVVPPTPPPAPPPAPKPITTPPGTDVVDPVLTFALPTSIKHGAIKALKAGTFELSFSVNEPGKIKARLGLKKGKKTTTIATGSSKVAKAGKVHLKFKLSKAGKKALKKLKKAKLVLTVITSDAAGNTTTSTKSFSTTG